jgi:hypothetical protein
VGIPGRVVVSHGARIEAIDLHHENLPDPVVEMFRSLQRRVDRLEARLGRDEGLMAERAGVPLPASVPIAPPDADDSAGEPGGDSANVLRDDSADEPQAPPADEAGCAAESDDTSD